MPEALAKRLRTFLAEHWRENEADLLFCNKAGKPMVRNKVALKLQETLKQLGIERAALHAFRHMAQFRRWRTGKKPQDCTYAQLEVVPPQELMAIFARGR